MLHLSDIINHDCIKIPLKSDSKQGIIEELINLLACQGYIEDKVQALKAVLEREHTRTTGIGNAFAIPHGKTSAARDLVIAIGVCEKPVNFESIDGKPVKLVVMLLSPPEMTGPHIQALARVSRLMSFESMRRKFMQAKSAAEMIELIQKAES